MLDVFGLLLLENNIIFNSRTAGFTSFSLNNLAILEYKAFSSSNLRSKGKVNSKPGVGRVFRSKIVVTTKLRWKILHFKYFVVARFLRENSIVVDLALEMVV